MKVALIIRMAKSKALDTQQSSWVEFQYGLIMHFGRRAEMQVVIKTDPSVAGEEHAHLLAA